MSLSNYGYGLSDNSPDTPWNEPEVPERDFEVTCSQSLSRTATVTTNNYIPCAEDVWDDGVGYHDEWADTSDTNWTEEYYDSNHYTPIQLIKLFKERCELELKSLDNSDTFELTPSFYKKKKRELKHLIEECEGWTEDETEICEG